MKKRIGIVFNIMGTSQQSSTVAPKLKLLMMMIQTTHGTRSSGLLLVRARRSIDIIP